LLARELAGQKKVFMDQFGIQIEFNSKHRSQIESQCKVPEGLALLRARSFTSGSKGIAN
jgi:hypothetical protein